MKALIHLCDEVDRLAFKIPGINPITPALMELTVAARRAYWAEPEIECPHGYPQTVRCSRCGE